MEIIAQIITNVLTAFYQPFGFSVVLSVMVMFFYLFAYEPGRGRGGRKRLGLGRTPSEPRLSSGSCSC